MKIILTALLLLAGVALAAEKMMVAYCTTGQGCTFWLSALDAEEAEVVIDAGGVIAANPKGIIVFVKQGDGFDFNYVDTKRSRKELDRVYGGAGNDEIVLFPFGNEVQPKDGRWTAKPGAVRIKAGCPSTMRSGLEQGLRSAAVQSGNKKFSKPFKPTDLLNSKDVRWIKLGANRYRAQINLGSSGVYKIFFDFTLVSPSKISAVVNSTIRLPSIGTCNATSDYLFSRG